MSRNSFSNCHYVTFHVEQFLRATTLSNIAELRNARTSLRCLGLCRAITLLRVFSQNGDQAPTRKLQNGQKLCRTGRAFCIKLIITAFRLSFRAYVFVPSAFDRFELSTVSVCTLCRSALSRHAGSFVSSLFVVSSRTPTRSVNADVYAA